MNDDDNKGTAEFKAKRVANEVTKKQKLLNTIRKDTSSFHNLLGNCLFYGGFFILILAAKGKILLGLLLMYFGILILLDLSNKRFNALLELLEEREVLK